MKLEILTHKATFLDPFRGIFIMDEPIGLFSPGQGGNGPQRRDSIKTERLKRLKMLQA